MTAAAPALGMRSINFGLCILIATHTFGCGSPEPPQTSERKPPASSATASPASPAAAPQTSAAVYCEMTVVDYEDKPLSDMVPIATMNPNAFDHPVASGNPTDEAGRSSVQLPPNTRLFVRAWDPTLHMFPNNFFEIPASHGGRTAPTRITMVPASAVEAVLQGPAQAPLAATEVEMMLVHPKQGPWWPARAITDAQGSVRFSPVPPGEYLIQIEAKGIGQTNLPVAFLPPTQTANLGTVTLTP